MTADDICDAILSMIHDRETRYYRQDIDLILCGSTIWDTLMATFHRLDEDDDYRPSSGAISGVACELAPGALADSIRYVSFVESSKPVVSVKRGSCEETGQRRAAPRRVDRPTRHRRCANLVTTYRVHQQHYIPCDRPVRARNLVVGDSEILSRCPECDAELVTIGKLDLTAPEMPRVILVESLIGGWFFEVARPDGTSLGSGTCMTRERAIEMIRTFCPTLVIDY